MESGELDQVEQQVERLAKTFQQLTDAAVRKHFVAGRLAEMEDELVVDVLRRLQERALQGDSACTAVISTGLEVRLLNEQFGKSRVVRLSLEAQKKGYQAVLSLFRTLQPVKNPEGDEDAFYRYGLSGLTLGERKSAARSLDRDVINRVGYDVDPLVIRQLLQNPRLTENNVIVIAARRPNHPGVIEEIYRSPKWSARPEVRIAIIRNPYTPPHLAIALVPTLLRQHLREVMMDINLHQNIREVAEHAYKIKSRISEDQSEIDAEEESEELNEN